MERASLLRKTHKCELFLLFCWLSHLKMSFYYPTSHNQDKGQHTSCALISDHIKPANLDLMAVVRNDHIPINTSSCRFHLQTVCSRYEVLFGLLRRQVNDQCDQIGRFIGLSATFQSLWQQLICPNLPDSQSISVKVSKSLIFLVKSFLGKFYRHLAIFIWSHCKRPPFVECGIDILTKADNGHWLWLSWQSGRVRFQRSKV